MNKLEQVKEQIQNLINSANVTTGKSDSTLTAGVQRLISGYGTGEGNETILTDGVFTITPKVLLDFNGILDNMNTNTEFPSTEYYGMYVNNVSIEYGKHYLVEYNGESYEVHGYTMLRNVSSGVPDLSTAVCLGNTSLLFEWIMRQSADSEDDAALSSVLFLLLSLVYGITDISNSDIPFQLIRMFSDSEGIEAGSTLFLVNNGNAECNLRITEFKIDVEHPVNEVIQADYLQFDETHPGFIQNKLAGIDPLGVVFYDGLGEDLSITPQMDSNGDIVGWSAPLNPISGIDVLGPLFSFIKGYNSDVDFYKLCMIVRSGEYTRMLYLPSVLTRGPYDSNDKEYLEELTIWMNENPYMLPFVDADEPCNIVVILDATGIYDSDTTATVAEGTETGDVAEEEVSSLSLKATIYTNLVNMPGDTRLYVELASCKQLDKKFLPAIHENDLPPEALTYTQSTTNLMIRDSVNNFDYIIISKNGVLETYCRCANIAVTNNPTKMTYYKGNNFDPTGMVITATCQDGTTKNVTSQCTHSPTTLSSTGTKTVTISFEEAGHTYTTTLQVTVTS